MLNSTWPSWPKVGAWIPGLSWTTTAGSWPTTRRPTRCSWPAGTAPPAAVANATWLDGALHLLGAVVLPEHRGHGLYRALIDVRLGLAWEKGVGLISVRARQESSGPILERRGFRRAFGYPSFHFAPAAQPGKNS